MELFAIIGVVVYFYLSLCYMAHVIGSDKKTIKWWDLLFLPGFYFILFVAFAYNELYNAWTKIKKWWSKK